MLGAAFSFALVAACAHAQFDPIKYKTPLEWTGTCASGTAQSPINILTAQAEPLDPALQATIRLPTVESAYIKNVGSAIQVRLQCLVLV
jgi:carbonic anhydrase